MVPKGCSQCFFTECRKKQPGKLLTLFVRGSPAAGVPVAFRDADGEVHFPCIIINDDGSLKAVLQNRWEDGRGGGGHYSLLHHAKALLIGNDLRAIRDLASYVGGTYRLGEYWQRQELSRNMMVTVTRTDESASLVRWLGEYFRRLVVVSDLDAQNTVDTGCYQHVFANCGWVQPRSLVVDAPLGGGQGKEVVQFCGAVTEVRVPSITIGPHGSLAAVVRNSWWNGKGGAEGGSGYYSLLQHARELVVRDNPGALRDLLAYAEGRYDPGEHWRLQKLGRGLRIVAWCTDTDLSVAKQLRQHFDAVVARVPSAPLQADSVISAGCVCFVFTDCRAVAPRSLVVDAEADAAQKPGGLEFQGAGGEVCFPSITIGPHGSLGAVLHNRWEDGMGGGGRYSLLHRAQRLEVVGNPRAAADLAAYVKGKYPLDARWQWQRPSRGMEIVIRQARVRPRLVWALTAHFTGAGVLLRDVHPGRGRRGAPPEDLYWQGWAPEGPAGRLAAQ